MSQQSKGLKRVIRATINSWRGLLAAWRHEAAFREECLLSIVLIPVALWLGQDAVERSLLIATIALVLLTELVNSAIEAAIDRIGPERHELSGRAKDIGSAAVFVSMMLTLVVWALIAIQRFA